MLALLSFESLLLPLWLPLELEVCSAVLPGRSAGQHYPGLHQDTEEELVLGFLRGPDDAVVQHPWQSLKILQIASLNRTDEPRYFETGAGAGHSTRLPGCARHRHAGFPSRRRGVEGRVYFGVIQTVNS
jgi:hypothetical protein